MKTRESHLTRVVDVVRHHTTRKVITSPPDAKVERSTSAIEDLLARSRHIIKVASSVSNENDGFSSTTPGNGSPGGGKGGRKLMSIPDENGQPDLVPTSTTEVAALAGIRAMPDPIARIGRDQLADLEALAAVLERMAGRADRFDNLRNTAVVPDPPMCWVAQVKYKLPWDIAWEPYRTTDFVGVLAEPFDEPRKVSSFVYWYTRRTRQLPTHAEMSAYLHGSIVKVKA